MARNSNAGNGKYNQRRWAVPSKRAKNYAEERKVKVHKRGPKRARSLPIMRRVSVPVIFRHRPTTQVFTSIRRLSPRVSPRQKQEKFPSVREDNLSQI
jgi:hypothetical protein